MAITAASYLRSEQTGPTTYRVVVDLTDAAAPNGHYEYGFVVSGASIPELRDDASRQIAAKIVLDNTKNLLAGIAPGTSIPITAPAPVALTAKEQWRADASRLRQLRQAIADGVTNATADANALATSLNSGYQAGFL